MDERFGKVMLDDARSRVLALMEERGMLTTQVTRIRAWVKQQPEHYGAVTVEVDAVAGEQVAAPPGGFSMTEWRSCVTYHPHYEGHVLIGYEFAEIDLPDIRVVSA